MDYCHRCGTYAEVGDATMCGPCRRAWQPAAARPGDLGYRGQQPQPTGDP